jgi:hypothetical protein
MISSLRLRMNMAAEELLQFGGLGTNAVNVPFTELRCGRRKTSLRDASSMQSQDLRSNFSAAGRWLSSRMMIGVARCRY